MGKISHDILLECLKYDPDTGMWTWLAKISDKVVIGNRAGHLRVSNGYWYIKIFGGCYASAPLAWFYVTGEWPPALVDHKNLIKDDDRWGNLRLAMHSQNAANAPISKCSSTGIKGVRLYRNGRFSAQIKVDKKYIHLGYHETKEGAAAAYESASRRYFWKFARTS